MSEPMTIPQQSSPKPRSQEGAVAQQLFAIRLSLIVGVLMLVGKTYAFFITGSAAILSDAAESVVHVAAVAFAAFSVWLSIQPPDHSHPYGHDKISFFSAGIEGVMIVLAAVYIIYEAVARWVGGLELRNLESGTMLVATAATINAGLGAYLLWTGKRYNSIILTANGKHVWTDVWTSLGVIVGLGLVMLTGWSPFDPILAILIALNILWSGGRLVRQSIGGLMDEVDPKIAHEVMTVLTRETEKRGLTFHQLRHRRTGNALWMELHLQFPATTSIEQAHWQATEIEAAIKKTLTLPSTITTHLEPIERHEEVHRALKNARE
jgi:cation diffusion facilitator family transporter